MDVLGKTSLKADERTLLEAFVDALRDELGDQLHAVWLFGSRARGEISQDPYSDVDVLVIVDDASWDARDSINTFLRRTADRLGLDETPWFFSVHIRDPAWLEQRREVRSFFLQEVDRDKVVLFEDFREPAVD